jgi:hypothetical protein
VTDPKPGRAEIAFVSAVVAAALGLRLWGIAFGLPHVYHHDEGFEIYRAIRLGMGGFDLDRTGKGGLYFILFLEYGAYFAFLRITGAVGSVAEFAQRFAEDASTFWLLGRTTVAVMGAATVALVAWQARRMRGVRAAVLAGLFLAASTQHVEDSHFATVDVPMTLFTFAAVVLIVEDVTGRRRLNPWGFAAVAAFATLNKIPAALLFIPYFLGAYLRDGWLGPRGVLRPSTLAIPALAAILFAVANPGVWLQWGKTMAMLSGAVGVATPASGWRQEPGANRWLFYLGEIVSSQGIGGLALAGVGAVLGARARCRGTWLHLAFLAAFLTVLSASGSPHLYYGRYVLPLLPGIALLAALGLDRLATQVAGAGARGHVLAAGLALLVIASPLAASIRVSSKLAGPDTRTQALDWVRSHVPAGSRVLLEGSAEDLAQLVIPLPPSPAFVERMIEDIATRDPGKASFWRIKARTLQEPTYDLLTVDHLAPWESLSAYEARGASWIVIRRDRFDGRPDSKYAAEILASRHRFYRELRASPQWRERISFPTGGELAGHDLEVWERLAAPAAGPAVR